MTLETFFKLREHGTSVKTEIIAGVTTFLTMAYIIFVNPAILGETGMNVSAVFVATCLAAALGSAVMGLAANYPIAIAPGMGLNAYFTYTVCLNMHLPWQQALATVLLSGVLFLIVSVVKVRELIVNAIPRTLKLAIAAGIGLFLALVALKSAGLVTGSGATLVTLGDVKTHEVLLATLGFFLILALEYRRVPGAIIISVLTVTALSIWLDYTEFKGVFAAPPLTVMARETLLRADFSNWLNAGFLGVTFTFLLVSLFDTTGTLIGVAHTAGLLRDGKLPRLKRALLADSLATVGGAACGTSPCTSYIESSAGTAAGGRTGLTCVVVALLFIVALWFSPLAAAIPAFATAPALCYVAILMMRSLADIDWRDLTESAPAVITAVGMPFTYSIADGIAFGFITFSVGKILTGRFKDLPLTVVFIALLWAVKFVCFN
ncbi:MAG: NCS2 family permease [Verrucomicrobiales bacterium]|jgi:AGZA family xanthine/uracil permease-like MFS transporter|nr:NCS2 family permease [Verrucomicrobiales bacterium]